MADTARTIQGVELPPAGRYELDPGHTVLGFSCKHMITRVRGRFTSFTGAIVVGDGLDDSSVEVTIEAASIETHLAARDHHLRSSDFLLVEEFPQMMFRSTAVRPIGGNDFELDGDLTMRGVTNPVTLACTYEGSGPDTEGKTIFAATGSTQIEREDWDMTWNQMVETGGLFVGKTVDISFEMVATRLGDA
jgi:polyisoprenoid-binding protein YceI